MTASLVVALIASVTAASGEPTYPTYYVGALVPGGELEAVGAQVEQALAANGLTVVGRHHPARSPDQLAIAYTAAELLDAARTLGGLASFGAVLRVGLEKTAQGVRVSYVNPDYLLRAYWRDRFAKVAPAASAAHDRVRAALASVGTAVHEPFGSRTDDGSQAPEKTEKQLVGYHYMPMMPYFEDVVELGSFAGLSAGRAKLEATLAEKRGGTALVYAVEVPGASAVLYGIALDDTKTGEPHFLPIIDRVESHVAAMPYELLLYEEGGKAKAVMLHGRYRIALYWNALTMGTFMKISGTPGDIESTFTTLLR